MGEDFNRRHWAVMVGVSALFIAVIFGVGFLLEWLSGRVA